MVRTIPARHRVATRIRELKVRARDVGDRRLKYGITVPPAPVDDVVRPSAPSQPGSGLPEKEDDEDEDLKRRERLYGEPPPVEWSNKCAKIVLGWLLVPNETTYSEPPFPKVIRIIGHGRVGKTTIATKVYNHPSVLTSFHRRVWINTGGLDKHYDDLAEEIIRQVFPAALGSMLGDTAVPLMQADKDAWLATTSDAAAGGKCFLLLVVDDANRFQRSYAFYFQFLFTRMLRGARNAGLAMVNTAVIVTTRHSNEDRNPNPYTLHVHKLDFALPRFYQQCICTAHVPPPAVC
ncbi:hypothetical protein ABZP36_008827 [Zizania latifolia]